MLKRKKVTFDLRSEMKERSSKDPLAKRILVTSIFINYK